MAYNNVINIINNTITNTTKRINIIVIKQERGNMMKFRCNKEELLKGIGIVSRFAYSKYQQSILECIHIKAEGEYIYMDTFDMTTAIRTKINAEITEEGETAIPARVLNEIVSKISSGEILFERINNIVQITGANASANLAEMDAAQFPVFPECEEDEEKMIEIKQDDLKAMIDKTINRPNHQVISNDAPIKYTTNEITYEPRNQNNKVIGNAFLLLSDFAVAIAAKQGKVNKL